MKPETIVGIVSMLVAMVLYSMGAWGAFKAKTLRKKDVLFLIGGVIFDTLGTGAMWVAAGGRFLTDLHTMVALVAYFLMLLLTVVGLWAVGWAKDKLAGTLAKFVLAPWALWALVFVWGFLQRPGK